jgi:acetyltransferase
LGNNYRGAVYPINPKRETVYNIKTFPAIGNIPDKIDLAIIATPAATVPGIAEECGRAGVAGLVIISSGFDEIGEKGKKMSNDILVVARRYGMRIIGPNCLGFIRPSVNLNASFAGKMALPGRVAFISQSGAFGTSMLDWSIENKIGFSGFFSIGSSIDISFSDLINYLNNDPETESIVIYMESLKKAPEFVKAARVFFA